MGRVQPIFVDFDPSIGWEVPDIDEAIQADPNLVMVGSPAQDETGYITTTLTLGTARPDPGDNPVFAWPLLDQRRNQINASISRFQLMWQILEGTAPTHANDMFGVAGVMTESNLNTATVDGVFGGVYSDAAGGWEMRSGDIVNGTASVTDDAQVGSPVGSDSSPHLNLKNPVWAQRIATWGMDANEEVVAGAAVAHAPAPNPQLAGLLWFFYSPGVGGAGGAGTDVMALLPRYKATIAR